jgi:methylamine dehydrogenase heavy chain
MKVRNRSRVACPRTLLSALCLLLSLAAALPGRAHAELPSDLTDRPTVLTLPTPPSKHWVWVNDFVFPHMADGMAYLVDGDTGHYLGTLSTGHSFASVLLPRDGKLIYSPEIYFSRGTRGTRTDVVTIYDASTLKVQGEIGIPAKRSSSMPMLGSAALTDDDRFIVIYNFTPAQSLTVVDTKARSFAGEIETPGCALVFPTGPRSFFSICADGSLLTTTLDDAGKMARQQRSDPLFDVAHDPVTEKPVRLGDTWYFVSFDGRIVPVKSGPQGPTLGASWWLTTAAQRKAGWRPGGLQQLAIHAGQNRLYAIMHQGGRDTHKDPGKDIWVYDLASHAQVLTIKTPRLSGAIRLSGDAHPLLFSTFIDAPTLDVFDPVSGKLLRSIANVGTSPTVLVTP